MPIEDDADGRRLLNGSVRVGQDVTVYVFPAGRFGQSETVNGMSVPLGERRRGVIAAVEPIDIPANDDESDWTMPGVRVTFDDNTVWDGVGHAFATWHGGVEPALADVKAAEAAEAHMHAHNEERHAAYMAEGFLADVELHPGTEDDSDEPTICIHMPWDDEDSEPLTVTPEQAEVFALRLLREATMVRLLRSGVVHVHADHDPDGHDCDGH